MANSPQTDFAEAHRRHWRDAELLYCCERWGNADHLFGFSAECGLKAVMVRLGMMALDEHGNLERKYRKHFPSLWTEFSQFADGHLKARDLRLLPEGKSFSDWSVYNRYSRLGFTERQSVDRHRNAASKILRMVEEATIDAGS